MKNILVSGLINLETSLQIETFPVAYDPVRYPYFGVNSTISGVGYNVAKALTRLGDRVTFLSITGKDAAGTLARLALEQDGIPAGKVLETLDHTPQSVILYDRSGRRQINVDLKDIQYQDYPQELFEQSLDGCDLAVLCNINFSRPFLERAKRRGIQIATDVHAISSLDDDYNRDFMAAATILFQSDEHLPVSPEEWVDRVWRRFGTALVVVGMGARGALLGVRSEGRLHHQPAIYTRPVVSTIGAGDALFSSFVHFYLTSGDPYDAIRKAAVFASYKIGESGAADGLLNEAGLEKLYQNFPEGNVG